MPEMAERYAMYNMFLGLRATQSTDDGCAMAVLDATKAAATEWSRTHEDPDLAADLMLVDQYHANLAAKGAIDDERPVTACPVAGDPYQPIPVDNYPVDDVDPPVHYACSAGGASGGLPVVLVGLALVLRRRRRG